MFDLDGTLLDTRRDLASAVNAIRAEHGREPLKVATVTRYVGDGLAMLVRRSLRGRRTDLEEATRRCARHYRRHMLDQTIPYPGVVAGLRRLKKAGYRLALVSNKPVAGCRRLLRHFGLSRLFERISGGDSTERRKPHPEPLQLTLRALGVRPEESWMIGDHWTDLETARRAGVRSIWMSRGMGRRGSRRPDRTFRRFSELTAFFTMPYTEQYLRKEDLMKKNALRVVSAAMLVAFFMVSGAACEESAPAMATAQFAAEGGEQSVQLAPGQVLEVRLPGNPTTGYTWTLESDGAQEILVPEGDVSYQSDAPDRMGAGGIFKFHFTAARAGSATIRFVYRRSWEKDVAPLYTAVLNVTVP